MLASMQETIDHADAALLDEAIAYFLRQIHRRRSSSHLSRACGPQESTRHVAARSPSPDNLAPQTRSLSVTGGWF
jgi:hypothetical protein